MTDSGAYWFPAKRYGWGWGPPKTWHGWAVLVVWGAAFVFGSIRLHHQHGALVWAYRIAMVLLLIAICYLKGEPPKWRWGDTVR
jgi:hypothetical protein